MKAILAIDPGASGGFAWRDGDKAVDCKNMPEGMTAQCDWLKEKMIFFAHNFYDGCDAVMEQTGTHRIGNSAGASVKFSRHCGHIEAALYMLSIPTTQVTPAKWQKAVFGTLPKDKMARKRAIKEEMQRRYPHLEVTLKTADALGILTYAIEREKS